MMQENGQMGERLMGPLDCHQKILPLLFSSEVLVLEPTYGMSSSRESHANESININEIHPHLNCFQECYRFLEDGTSYHV